MPRRAVSTAQERARPSARTMPIGPFPGKLNRRTLVLFALEELELVIRHLREAESRVRRQRELISQMRARALSTAVAETILKSFVGTAEAQEQHLHAIILSYGVDRTPQDTSRGQ